MKLPRTEMRGFTLIEILTAVAIFSVAMLVSTSLFVTTTKSQKRIQSVAKVQDDARFVLESMVRQVRVDGVDYAYYLDPDGDGSHADLIPLTVDPLNPSPQRVEVLVVKGSDGERTFYARYQHGTRAGQPRFAIGLCTTSVTETCLAAPNGYTDITPGSISVEQFGAWISPGSDPNAVPPNGANDCRTNKDDGPLAIPRDYGYASAQNVCTCDPAANQPDGSNLSCYPSQTCDAGVCMNANEQQRATIVITSKGGGSQTSEDVSLTLQTTVSSRIYHR